MKSTVLIFALAVPCLADTLTLKNGERVNGTMIRGTARQISFQVPREGTRQFSIDEIESITFGELSPSASRTGNRDRREGGGRASGPNSISAKFSEFGGESGILGGPVSNETATADGRGRILQFRDATILWSPETGAHEVHGGIRAKYASMGWERGALGYPVTDETSGANGGKFNHFEKGSIYWNPSGGAFAVLGEINQEYTRLGRDRSSLLYPIGDQVDNGGTRTQQFQNGTITWSQRDGVRSQRRQD